MIYIVGTVLDYRNIKLRNNLKTNQVRLISTVEHTRGLRFNSEDIIKYGYFSNSLKDIAEITGRINCLYE